MASSHSKSWPSCLKCKASIHLPNSANRGHLAQVEQVRPASAASSAWGSGHRRRLLPAPGKVGRTCRQHQPLHLLLPRRPQDQQQDREGSANTCRGSQRFFFDRDLLMRNPSKKNFATHSALRCRITPPYFFFILTHSERLRDPLLGYHHRRHVAKFYSLPLDKK